jgi:hypothetical protein
VDGFHCSNLRGTVTVENCFFHGLLDDPINIHGTTAVVERVEGGNTVIGRWGHKRSRDFPLWAMPGDAVSFFNRGNMGVIAQLPITGYALAGDGLFRLTFDSPLPPEITAGLGMENVSAAPGVVVRGCFFGSSLARGLLVSTPKPVLIERNVFESSGSAILLAGDTNYWFESGACHDVIIRDNQFLDCMTIDSYQYCGGVISIWPIIPEPDAHIPYHTNIRIERNIFRLCNCPAIYAHNVDGLVFTDNILMESHGVRPQKTGPFHNLIRCNNVFFGNNTVTGFINEEEGVSF